MVGRAILVCIIAAIGCIAAGITASFLWFLCFKITTILYLSLGDALFKWIAGILAVILFLTLSIVMTISLIDN